MRKWRSVTSPVHSIRLSPETGLEHDAEKCERFSDDIMLQLYNVEQDSDFRPTRPKIILF
ncbi:hypothetical protein GFL58_01540 [Rhizobium leguminosarum bv. viciae]|nr:hypothetical protein [Rhizobium leguminosarum bv. viciae]